ncbi:MAG: hypothetical protein Q9197_004091 [Variospora fuerteventurae]
MQYSSIIALALASAVVALPASHSTTATSSSDPGSEETVPASTSFRTMHPSGGKTYGASGTGSSFVPTATGVHPASQTGSPDLSICGSKSYRRSDYKCYSDKLCPIIEGIPTLLCGDSCYFESLHCCKSGVLVTKTSTDGTCTDNTEEAPDTGDADTECPAPASTSTASTSTASTAPASTSTASTKPASTKPASTSTASTAPKSTSTASSAPASTEPGSIGELSTLFNPPSAAENPNKDEADPPAKPGRWQSFKAGVAPP